MVFAAGATGASPLNKGKSDVRNVWGVLILAAFCVVSMTPSGAAATDATVTHVITNSGVDVKGKGDFHIYPQGTHGPNGTANNANVGNGASGQPVQLAEGTYDVRITFEDDRAQKIIWLDGQTISGTVAKTVEVGLPLTDVRYLITNGGVDVKGNADFHIYPQGTHSPNGDCP
jgi:hypothetical protein